MAARKPKEAASPDDEFYGTPAESVDSRKWEFEEGDTLAGVVLSVFDGDGDYGPYQGFVVEPNPKFTTEADGDNSAVSADDPLVWYVNENSAAFRSIPRDGIAVGDKVRIDYEGEKKSKGDRMFKKFNVKVQKAEA